ncbi:hypothetical protein BED47_07740 [Gottfriedia luciferensis]|uniref:Peptidase MA-like domain-containing protein n=1 Tax=Gottfriedia luciferensis TaxID=178774 RepID=A0ABX2ZP66_9BACI|nr:hypothetical protein [Gottfriedia luciferensis]ODG91535.1 hypothetical protein BED47_07740 [Gottfriedia luciferensis]
MKKILLVLLFVIGFILALVIKQVFFTGLKLEHSKYIYNATFMYNKSEENYLPVSVQTVKVAKKSVDDLLGTNNKDIDIFILNEKKFEKVAYQDLIAGFYDEEKNAIYLRTSKPNLPIYFENTLAHEYTHFRLIQVLKSNDIISSKLPFWFHEGFATYVGEKIQTQWGENVDKSEFPLISFEQLNTHEQWDKVGGPYQQSYFAIEEIVERSGKEGVLNILNEMKNGEEFYSALQHVTNLTMVEFENQIRLRIKQYGNS